ENGSARGVAAAARDRHIGRPREASVRGRQGGGRPRPRGDSGSRRPESSAGRRPRLRHAGSPRSATDGHRRFPDHGRGWQPRVLAVPAEEAFTLQRVAMKPIRKLAFVVNEKKEGAPALSRELAGIARERGVAFKESTRFPLPRGYLEGFD